MKTVRVVFISIPREEANALSRSLVEKRLAACVNIVPQIESWYRWDGKVQQDHEALLIVKTTQARMDGLMTFVQENHPYDLPEIIALGLTEGLPEYVAWVTSETESE